MRTHKAIDKICTPCELCGLLPEVFYASGRFCSAKCSRSFSTSRSREDISRRVSKKLKQHSVDAAASENIPACRFCKRVPQTRHKTGTCCLECAYKYTSGTTNKILWESNNIDKHNRCVSCSSLFPVTWETKNFKTCSQDCKRAASSFAMIKRNVEGNFYQTFGRRTRYKSNGLDIACDSLIEWCALEHLYQTYSGKIKEIRRSSLRISYEDEGKQRVYVPDFEVDFSDGTKMIVECKSEQSGKSPIWVRYHREAVKKRQALETHCSKHNQLSLWFTQKTRADLYRIVKQRVDSLD